MDRKQKLQNLVDSAFDGNQAQFAKAIRRSSAQVNHWLTGHRNLGDAGARHIELTLNLGIGYFDQNNSVKSADVIEQIRLQSLMISDEKASYVHQHPIGANEIKIPIPVLAAVPSMGSGETLTYDGDQIIDVLPVSKTWLQRNVKAKPHNLRVITGAGDSMHPTFSDGDMLLVDVSKVKIDIDGVYVLSAHERLFIKRVRQRMDGSFEVSSDNPTVKTVDILNGDHEIQVHGRVVWAWNGRAL